MCKLAKIQQLINNGNIDHAKIALEKLLQENSLDTTSNTGAVHMLASIYTKLGLLTKAKTILQDALAIAPNSASLHNHYGLTLYRQCDLTMAAKQFKLALKLQPDYFDAMINLALTCKAQNKTEEAITCLLAIIKAEPNHIRAHFFLGKFLLAEKLYPDAENEFIKITKIAPNDAEILTSIIKCLLEHTRYTTAKIYTEKLLQLQPKNIEVNYNLAIIETKLGNQELALNHYHAILQLDPHHFATLNNIAVLYLEMRNLDAARHYFQQALKLQPNNESIRYTLNALNGTATPDQAPSSYIKTLFDNYADHFEIHLRTSLDYRVPELLHENICNILGNQAHDLQILDLGCGTGLCGELFKPLAHKLIGVDLSTKMLALADKKNCYDELITADNLEYLHNTSLKFDLILAADVFVYNGNLKPIITACRNNLKPDGLLAFSTEICEDEALNFMLQPSGRFCHSKKHIASLAKEAGMCVLLNKTCPTRTQYNQQVNGNIVVFSNLN